MGAIDRGSLTGRALKAFLIFLCLILTAVSCAPAVTADVDPAEVVEDIVADYSLDGGFLFRSGTSEEGEYLDPDLISTYYGDGEKVPDFSRVTDYCVYIDESNAREMSEVGLFKLSEGSDLQQFASFLKNRVAVRLSNAKSYPDINKSTLKGARFGTLGNYVYYVVVKNASAEIAARLERILLGETG